MAARPKLTYRRETRLLALLVFGEPFECACRAINVSSTGVRKKMSRDPGFAARVQMARAAPNRSGSLRVTTDDWHSWAPPMLWDVD